MVLTDFGLRNVPYEQSLYLLAKKDEYTIVLVSTDNLLRFYCNFSIFHRIIFICASDTPEHHRRVHLSNLST